MRHFATESGKSKGQFYTPSEVSRIMAKVIGISPANSIAATTAYDPTCGSGSLLLKVAAEAGKHITLEGQEKDVTTAGLARMNMILHDFPAANILRATLCSIPSSRTANSSAPTIMSSPIHPSPTRLGPPDSYPTRMLLERFATSSRSTLEAKRCGASSTGVPDHGTDVCAAGSSSRSSSESSESFSRSAS